MTPPTGSTNVSIVRQSRSVVKRSEKARDARMWMEETCFHAGSLIESLAELEENIRDAYRMMIEEEGPPPSENAHTKEIEVLV